MAIERKQFRFSSIEYLSPHSTILRRSNSSLPADPTFSKKTDWCHLHRSLFLIEPHREDH